MQLTIQQIIEQANVQAKYSLHPLQQAISVGDCWVRAKEGIGPRIVEFGYVLTATQVYDLQIRSGANRRDARASAVAAVSALDKGYMFGQKFTRRGGDYGLTHKSHVWPISNDVVIAAQAARWIPERMSTSDRALIEAAFRALRTHLRSL